MTDLARAIIRTTAWFSLFDAPVTAFALWKWMLEPDRAYTLAEVYEALETDEALRVRLVSKNGFWALAGTDMDAAVRTRSRRFLDAVRKMRLARRVARYARMLPGVEAVGIVNTLAWWNTTSRSDIDFFVITRPGSIWQTRLLLVAPYLRRRPRPGAENPLCFSFFASEDALGFAPLLLERDPYFAYWVPSVVPLFDRAGAFSRLRAENAWADAMLPHARQRDAHPYLRVRADRSALPAPAALEAPARRVQEKRFPEAIRRIMNQDSRVVVGEGVLKFHENDRRADYRDAHARLTARVCE